MLLPIEYRVYRAALVAAGGPASDAPCRPGGTAERQRARSMTGPRVMMRPSSHLEREDFIAHAIKKEENK
jgi:hypothetical protein